MESILDEFNSYFSLDISNTPYSIEECQRLRYQVYCEETKILDANSYKNRKEIDLYDSRSCHALLRHNPTGLPVATVRVVLPNPGSDGASLQIEQKISDESCRRLWNSYAFEKNKTVEITRFIVSNGFRRRRGEETHIFGGTPTESDFQPHNDKRLYPFITIGLFKALIDISAQYDIEYWVAAMEPGLIRLLSRFGIAFIPLGEPVEYYGRRQPCIGVVRTLAADLYAARPEIWRFVTTHGQHYALRSFHPVRVQAKQLEINP